MIHRVTREVFDRQVGYLASVAVSRCFTEDQLFEEAKKRNYRTEAAEKALRELRFARDCNKSNRDKGFIQLLLSEGIAEAFIVKELVKRGHKADFADSLIGRIRTDCSKAVSEEQPQRLQETNPAVEEVPPAFQAKRSRSKLRTLPTYVISDFGQLRAAVLDLIWRCPRAVNSKELADQLLGSESKAVFKVCCQLETEGLVSKLPQGEKFFKFLATSKRRGYYLDGQLLSVAKLAKLGGISKATMQSRLDKMSAAEAIAAPVDEKRKASRDCAVRHTNRHTIRHTIVEMHDEFEPENGNAVRFNNTLNLLNQAQASPSASPAPLKDSLESLRDSSPIGAFVNNKENAPRTINKSMTNTNPFAFALKGETSANGADQSNDNKSAGAVGGALAEVAAATGGALAAIDALLGVTRPKPQKRRKSKLRRQKRLL